jgi:hypothetical protein
LTIATFKTPDNFCFTLCKHQQISFSAGFQQVHSHCFLRLWQICLGHTVGQSTAGCTEGHIPIKASPALSLSFFLFFFFGHIGGVSHLQGRCSILPLEPLHQPFHVLGIFKVGSYELFLWANFEPLFNPLDPCFPSN